VAFAVAVVLLDLPVLGVLQHAHLGVVPDRGDVVLLVDRLLDAVQRGLDLLALEGVLAVLLSEVAALAVPFGSGERLLLGVAAEGRGHLQGRLGLRVQQGRGRVLGVVRQTSPDELLLGVRLGGGRRAAFRLVTLGLRDVLDHVLGRPLLGELRNMRFLGVIVSITVPCHLSLYKSPNKIILLRISCLYERFRCLLTALIFIVLG